MKKFLLLSGLLLSSFCFSMSLNLGTEVSDADSDSELIALFEKMNINQASVTQSLTLASASKVGAGVVLSEFTRSLSVVNSVVSDEKSEDDVVPRVEGGLGAALDGRRLEESSTWLSARGKRDRDVREWSTKLQRTAVVGRRSRQMFLRQWRTKVAAQKTLDGISEE